MWIVFIAIVLIILVVVLSIRAQGQRDNAIGEIAAKIESEGFKVAKRVNDTNSNYALAIDDINNKWAVINANTRTADIFEFKDLLEYEVLEDGDSIVKGRVGSAIAGGILFGGIGAVAGASIGKMVKTTCSSMSVRILTNDLNKSQYIIPLIKTQTKTDGIVYKSAQTCAQEITSLLAIIKARAEA